VQLAKELGELAFAALNDLDARFARPGFPPASQDRQLDAIVIFLLQSEQTIGSVLSPLSADLERRTRNRNLQKRAGKNTSFAQIRYKGIKQVWAAERLGSFRKRYEEKTGQPAPDDFTVNSRFVPGGWQISDKYRKCFERSDYQDFMRDMDALYRRRNGLPAKGEGWLAQIHLTKCVEEVLPGYEIIREAKAPWLGAQRLDVYVPAFKVAIEYQGQQHYFPLEIWGGEQGLKDRQALDKTKRNSCKEAGVILIEWSYKEPISPETVRSKLKAYGLFPEFGPA
jgi:hypothetical protein